MSADAGGDETSQPSEMDVSDGPGVDDTTAEADNIHFELPAVLDESLMREAPPTEVHDQPVGFTVVTGGTQRGGPNLAGSDGFTYVVNRTGNGRLHWRCSIRNKQLCLATVLQTGDTFQRGPAGHTHTPIKGAANVPELETVSSYIKECSPNTFISTSFWLQRPSQDMEEIKNRGGSKCSRRDNRHQESMQRRPIQASDGHYKRCVDDGGKQQQRSIASPAGTSLSGQSRKPD